MSDQLSMFDFIEPVVSEEPNKKKSLSVVYAQYIDTVETDWEALFDGYDELYAMTFSSGIQFMNMVLAKFEYAEVVFGCEEVIANDIAKIIATQIDSVQRLVASKDARAMAERMKQDSLKLFVSRKTKSHAKIYLLRAKDGRTRVITGSANMSATAFISNQYEDIVYYDDHQAFDSYMKRFDAFRNEASDEISHKAFIGSIENREYLEDNVEEVPIFQPTDKMETIILEENTGDYQDEIQIIANVKGLEHELKPMLPKPRKKDGKLLISGDAIRAFKRKVAEHRKNEKNRRKQLPKLHIDYETRNLFFNESKMDLTPASDKVTSDVSCILRYLDSLKIFYGDFVQSQKDYFRFMNWYFASPFMPYLRFIASQNSYDVTPFPVVGIIYGESNGGKSTFIRLLSKLMTGYKIPMNSSNDFTSTRIEDLKRSCEGLPINIDDLAKTQFSNHSEKVIKDDEWGIQEGFINYPSIAITTNKLASLPQDITKRTVTCHIDTRIDKEIGAMNSRKINESMKSATTALYCEYVRRMFGEIENMVEKMKVGEENYFPDIFKVSSNILLAIFSEFGDVIPEYIRELSYTDYFGAKAVGRSAMEKIMLAWKNEPKQFRIDKKNNKLIYSYPEQGRHYELGYLQEELPPALNPQKTGKCLLMDLDRAKEIFDISFRRGFFF